MPEVLSVPITPGIHQENDRTMLPAGTLIDAANVRVRKGGAIGKRCPTVAAGRVVSKYLKTDGTAGTGNAITGYVGEITELNDGSQALIADNRCYVRRNTGDEWVESGRTSRALPVSATWVQYNEGVVPGSSPALFSGTGNVTCATQGDYTAVSYVQHVTQGSLTITQCCLTLYGKNGVVIVEKTAGQISEYPQGRQNPKIIAANGVFLWFYQQADGNSADTNLYVRTLDPVAKTLSAENAFTSTKAAGGGYDVTAYQNGTQVLVAHVPPNTEPGLPVGHDGFKVALYDAAGSFFTATAVQLHDVTGDGLAGDMHLTVYGDPAATQIWVGLCMKDASGARAVGFDGALASAESSNLLLSPYAGGTLVAGQLGIVNRGGGSSSVWVLVQSYFSAVRRIYQTVVSVCSLGLGTTPAPSNTVIPHWLPASRPFFGQSRSFMVWLHDDGLPDGWDDFQTNSFAWRNQRTYGLFTVVFANDSGGTPSFSMLQPELVPEERSTFKGMYSWLPEVALHDVTDDNGVAVNHALVPLLSPIQTQALADAESWAVILYEWETDIELMSRRRQIVEHAGGVLVLGGHLQENALDISNRVLPTLSGFLTSVETTGARGFENGFPRGPALIDRDTPNDSGGVLIGSATYQLCALYEHVDAIGRRHRSRPSQVVRVSPPDATSALSAQVAITDLSERLIASDAHGIVVHVFATQGNGSTFYRITPSSGAPRAWDELASTMVAGFTTIGLADTAIPAGEILYTQGNVVPNMPAPAHRFGCVGAGRVWLGGLFDPTMIECSKLETPQEPTQFTRNAAFRQKLPDPCTGLVVMDNTVVAFTRTGIYTLAAALAPNNQGAPALPQFQPLPSTIGCINPWSVRVVADGILFQSRRGLYILPRGFGPPELISAQVQDEIEGRLVTSSAVVDHQEHRLVLSCVSPTNVGADDGRLLVYDLDRHTWISSDDPGTGSEYGTIIASWNGRLALATRLQFGADIDLRVEDPDAWTTNLSNEDVTLELADLRPFGVMGRGAARVFQVLGEIRANATISATVFTDGRYSAAIDLPPQQVVGEVGDKFTVEWGLPVRDLNAVGVRLNVSPPDDGSVNEGLVIHSIGVEADSLPSKQRVPAERRA